MGFGTVLDASKLSSKGTGFHEDGRGNPKYKFGFEVVGCGDVNGDGLQDHMIKGKREEISLSYVVFGSRSYKATTHPETDLNGHNGFVITRNATRPDSMGLHNMDEAIGDINHDGFADVAVSYNNQGAYVIFGAPSFPAELDVDELDGTNGFFLHGTGQVLLGYSVAGGEDINGDDISDMVVSAQSDLFVLFGNQTGFNATVHVEDLHPEFDNGLRIAIGSKGWPMVSVADVTGDGYADILVETWWSQAPPDPYYGRDATSVFLVTGRKSPLFQEPVSLAEVASSEIVASTKNHGFGSVSAIGDVDNDGVGDFGVTTTFFQVYVVFGVGTSEGLPPFSYMDDLVDEGGASVISYQGGTGAFDFFADQISAVGDLNGDGIDDLIIDTEDLWCCNRKGDAFVIFGRPRNEWPKHLHTKNLKVGEGFRVDKIYGESTWSENSVAGIGDCNGDGLDDAAVATIQEVGRSNVIFGRRDNERDVPNAIEDDASTSFEEAEAEVDEMLDGSIESSRPPQEGRVPLFGDVRTSRHPPVRPSLHP